MLLNFQRQFARPVLDGTKRQTIRASGSRRRPAPGEWAHCYTGLRTRSTHKLGTWRIAQVDVLRMSVRDSGFGDVILGADRLGGVGLADLAAADGFKGTVAMHRWFLGYHGAIEFDGWVIRWDWLPVEPPVILPWEVS
jgi:hypothetical protein